MTPEKLVLDHISEQFVPGSVVIEDFPLFPYGKRVIDKNRDEMVFYLDLLTNTVKYTFPDKGNSHTGMARE